MHVYVYIKSNVNRFIIKSKFLGDVLFPENSSHECCTFSGSWKVTNYSNCYRSKRMFISLDSSKIIHWRRHVVVWFVIGPSENHIICLDVRSICSIKTNWIHRASFGFFCIWLLLGVHVVHLEKFFCAFNVITADVCACKAFIFQLLEAGTHRTAATKHAPNDSAKKPTITISLSLDTTYM